MSSDKDVLAGVIYIVLTVIAGIAAVPVALEFFNTFVAGETSFALAVVIGVAFWAIALYVIREIFAIAIVIVLLIVAGIVALANA
jgi:hypothetical protein